MDTDAFPSLKDLYRLILRDCDEEVTICNWVDHRDDAYKYIFGMDLVDFMNDRDVSMYVL